MPANPQRGTAVVILLVIVAAVAAAISGYIIFQTLSAKPAPSLTTQPPTPAAIKPETQYQNPFEKDTQYVNPFASYHNPFDALQ